MPAPGGLDDRFQLGQAWLPAQQAMRFLCAGNEYRRVSVASRCKIPRDGTGGDFFRGAQNFDDGKSSTVTEVVALECRQVGVFQCLGGKQMGVGQIADVNEVAYAKTVRGIEVIAEELYPAYPPGRHSK